MITPLALKGKAAGAGEHGYLRQHRVALGAGMAGGAGGGAEREGEVMGEAGLEAGEKGEVGCNGTNRRLRISEARKRRESSEAGWAVTSKTLPCIGTSGVGAKEEEGLGAWGAGCKEIKTKTQRLKKKMLGH